MASKLPRISHLQSLFVDLKRFIDDDCRASEDDDIPGMCVTIGWNDQTGDWSYQTGDNSYTGSAYHYPHWAVVYLYRRSNSRDLAVDAINQLADLASC
jgi:hypothetical protein